MLKQDRALLQRKIEDAVERSRESVMSDVAPSRSSRGRRIAGVASTAFARPAARNDHGFGKQVKSHSAAAAALAASLLAGPVLAQNAMFSTLASDSANNILNTQLRNSMLGVDGGAGHVPRGSAFRPLHMHAPERMIDTSYRADPAVAARVRRQFLDFVARTSGARGASDLAATFARADPIATWAKEAAPDGMRLGDVADAAAEYWVTNWVIANRRPDPPGQRVRDVRDQIRRVLSSNPSFARLDNAQRQEIAEVFIYNAILQGSVYQRALQTHDASLLQRASDAAVARFRNETHVDLRAMTLTPSGLEPKA